MPSYQVPARGKGNRLVTVRHATPRRNLRSILRVGIDPARSRGKLRAVWLHTAALSTWAVDHVARRHQTDDVIVLTVRVPRSALRRSSRRGVWFCLQVITPEQISAVNGLRLFVG